MSQLPYTASDVIETPSTRNALVRTGDAVTFFRDNFFDLAPYLYPNFTGTAFPEINFNPFGFYPTVNGTLILAGRVLYESGPPLTAGFPLLDLRAEKVQTLLRKYSVPGTVPISTVQVGTGIRDDSFWAGSFLTTGTPALDFTDFFIYHNITGTSLLNPGDTLHFNTEWGPPLI